MNTSILIIMPFVTVKAFYIPLLALAKILFKEGVNLTIVHCKYAMSRGCNSMAAQGLAMDAKPNLKRKFCQECYTSSKALTALYPWKTIWLENRKDKSKKTKLLKNKDIYKIAGYEIILNLKPYKKLSKKIQKIWKSRFSDLKNMAPQIEDIFNKNKYDLILCYNSLYGIHQLFYKISQKYNTPFFSIHEGYHNVEKGEYVIQKNHSVYFLQEINRLIKNKRSVRLSSAALKNVQDHIHAILKSSRPWNYSSKQSASITTTIKINNKVLVMLSSFDEDEGLKLLGIVKKRKKTIFKDQIEWLRWLFGFAKKNPHINFFVRPHPRIYPNKRDQVLSPFANVLEQMRTAQLPTNIFWPKNDEQGSVWDHLSDTKLVLNAWSSAADVFKFYKIPVITPFPELNASEGLTEKSASSINEFENTILENINRKVNPTTFLKWLNLLLTHNTIQIKWRIPFFVQIIRRFKKARNRSNYDIKSLVMFGKPAINVKKLKTFLGIS